MKVVNTNPGAGVGNLEADNDSFNVWTSEGTIFTGADNARIYDTMGRAYGVATSGKPAKVAPGLYVVVSGNKSRKVIVK